MYILNGPKTNAYCAFCRTPRRIYNKKRSGFFEFATSAGIAIICSYVFYQSLEPQSVVFFILSLVTAEIFIQTRWRSSILCPVCGFDPVLYVKDPLKAAEKVKKHLGERKKRPESVLTRPLNLPVIDQDRAKEIERMSQSGRVLSRQI